MMSGTLSGSFRDFENTGIIILNFVILHSNIVGSSMSLRFTKYDFQIDNIIQQIFVNHKLIQKKCNHLQKKYKHTQVEIATWHSHPSKLHRF